MPDRASSESSGGLYVTVIVSVPELPAASVAVTVMTLIPLCRAIPDMDHVDQEVVVIALPVAPVRFAQVTPVMPALPETVPAMSIGLELVV
jgi:hypothetical protein